MRKNPFFFFLLAFAGASVTGCAHTETVRVPSPEEVHEKEQDARRASEELVRVYWEQTKARFCAPSK